MEQRHLNYVDRVNLGGYYTPVHYVALAWKMLSPFLNVQTAVLDSACGYGVFLEKSTENITVGCDIDKAAVDSARKNNPQAVIFHANALQNVSRGKFNIPVSNKLAVIGNPPYNDRTSIIRQNIKSSNISIDAHIETRDLGMSFLLSYNALRADYVCVLHPLSYLIKQSNFNLLKNFTSNYKLKEGLIISSEVFSQSSKSIKFPIVIALYERDDTGMDYHYIRGFRFKTAEGKYYCQNDFDYISNYIKKYPSKYQTKKNNDSILFWTMRDINALKRNQTFVKNFGSNTIVIDKNKLDYYVYVDVFKRFADKVPYYFGNCDVLIDDSLFQKYKKYFLADAITNHPFLADYITTNGSVGTPERIKDNISEYFCNMLGEHYV